jgi:molybdopterin converting factor small subunit
MGELMIKVNLSLYGAFRQLGVSKITLALPNDPTVADLRKSLESFLAQSDKKILNALVNASVFATDETILKDGDKILPGLSLAILPPVCGG